MPEAQRHRTDPRAKIHHVRVRRRTERSESCEVDRVHVDAIPMFGRGLFEYDSAV